MTHPLAHSFRLLPVILALGGCVPPGSDMLPPPKDETTAAVPPPPGYAARPAAPMGVPPPPQATAGPKPGETGPEARRPEGRSIGSGSAFAVSQRGLAITNAHVIANCRSVTDISGHPLRVLAADRRADLALLDTGRPFPVAVRFRDRGGASLGETALVFGFPYGQALGTGINLTNGIVTGSSGIGGDPGRFQMNAAVQPGNSGGPVVDDHGLLLGVAVGRLNDMAVLRATGALPQGINFAIRAEAVENFLLANGVQPLRGGGGAVGVPAVSAVVAPAVFQVMCR